MSTALRAPAPVAVHCWPIPLQETLKQNSGSVSVGSLGPGVHKVCLSTLSVSGRYGVHQKATKIKCWRVCAGKGTLLHSWWGCKLVQSLWRTIWRFLSKLKMQLLYGLLPTSVELRKDAQWHVIRASSIDTIDISHFTTTDNGKMQQNN